MSKEKEIKFQINECGCHIITSHALDKDGYGRICRNKKQEHAHRYIYRLTYGEIPETMVIRHKCDTPSCINPEHLEIGTDVENVKDRQDRNRTAKGEDAGLVKLSEKDVEEILLDDKRSGKQLAKDFGVDNTAIYSIKQGKTWKHVYDRLKDRVSTKIIKNSCVGEKSGRSKLNDEKVKFILSNPQYSTKELTEMFKVCPSTINRIIRGDNWTHLRNN